jgi:two-component system, OmpR family, KDP operon response regulator KdpE
MPMSSPATVLVIDDEVQIRRFLRAGFELDEFLVLEADSAEAGLRMATLRPLDLIVVDLGLPDADGADLVERIRSWSAVPIIVLSVRSSEDEKVRLLELGADDYVVKPFGMAARRCDAIRAALPASLW